MNKHHEFFKTSTKIKNMDDEEFQVLMELDDTNIQFIEEESVEFKYLVFRIVNTIGDESIALANMAIMFRGETTSMVDILNIYLGLKNEENNSVLRLGTAVPDDDDLRVCRIVDWTNSVPLPLGNNLLNRLRIVVHIDGHVNPNRVKFGADLIPFPEVFLEGNPKMKRRMGNSVVRFQGGVLKDIENGLSALSMQEITPEVPTNSVSQLQNIIVSLLKPKEYWFDQHTIIPKPRTFLKL